MATTAIRSYMSAAKFITNAATLYTLTFDTEVYDTLGEFNTSTYKFTATVAGKYLFTCEVTWSGVSDGDSLVLGLYKNGITTNDWVFYTSLSALTGALTPSQSFSFVIDVEIGDWFVVQAMNQTSAGDAVWGRSSTAKLATWTITQVQ